MALSRRRAMIAPWGTGITEKSSDKARKRLFRNPLPCQPLHQASAANYSKKPEWTRCLVLATRAKLPHSVPVRANML